MKQAGNTILITGGGSGATIKMRFSSRLSRYIHGAVYMTTIWRTGQLAIGARQDITGDETIKTLIGQCRCRAVTYEVTDEFAYAVNCHCSNCRRATGSAFKPLAGIEIAKMRIVAGGESIVRHGDEAQYVHCGQCGSLLYAIVRHKTFVHVPMGTLNDAPSLRPTCHIFVGSKATWFEITDDLPQHDEFR